MKALVLQDYNCLLVQDLPAPSISRDEVLIRVRACAICGSDVHGLDGSTGRRIPPIVMGHEAAGVIEDVDDDVVEYHAGDRVTFDSTIYCGHCYFCLRGDVNLCDNRKVIGVSCADYRLNGAFAEYIAVPSRIIYRLPDTLSFERAAMVEPLSIAMHAIKRMPALRGANVVVVGAGMIGLLIIQLLKSEGCRKIIAIDLKAEKLDLALKFGATDILKSGFSEETSQAVRSLTGERGADAAFEVVGLPGTIHMAISFLQKGGYLTLVGNLSPLVELPLQTVVTRQITLAGSCASAGEYAACLERIDDGSVDVDTFISAVAPLEQGAAWFRRLYAGEPGLMKVILTP